MIMSIKNITRIIAMTALFTFSVAHAVSPVTNFEYDANGNLTKVTDGLSNATTQQYDAVNRLIQQSQPNPTAAGQLGTIKTLYNAIDEVTGVTDPRNLNTNYTKNAFGDVLTLTSPDTGSTTNTYDNAGNLLTRTDAIGKIATYTYDAVNRVTRITYKSNKIDETITFSYDQGVNGKGRLTEMTDLSGSTTWSYDALGHVTRKQQIVGNQLFDLEMQYDTAGRLIRTYYPSTRVVDYGYNLNGQINQVWVDGILMIDNIQYYPTGSVKSYVWGNAKIYQRNIDQDGRPASFTMGTELQVITYDNAGRITQIHRADPATAFTPKLATISTYAYDNLGRLTTNVVNTSSQNYTYDLSGNRTNLTIGASIYPYTIAAASNHLTAEAGPSPAKTYTYDTAGNTTANGQDIYTYYNSGRLKQVSRGKTNLYALQYNGLGQFVNRTNSNIRYLYDENGRLIGEYNSNGDVNQETVYLGDIPLLTLRLDTLIRTADNADNVATNKATYTGTWATATTLKGFYGTNYRSHVATASSTDKVVYTLTPTATQNFRVYAMWAAQATNATNAIYTIAPNTVVNGVTTPPTTMMVDQTQNGGAWNYLGSFDLNTAQNLTITLSAQGNGIVTADAVRIVPNTPANIQNLTYYIHTDHLNTPRVIVNQNNQLRWYWYPDLAEAFGANLPNENPASLGTFQYNLRFPGQLFDPSSGLSYNYYRDYNPRTGRYLQSDPIGLAGGINTYAYVGGNPLRYVDPKGLDVFAVQVGIAIPFTGGFDVGFLYDTNASNFGGVPLPDVGIFTTINKNYGGFGRFKTTVGISQTLGGRCNFDGTDSQLNVGLGAIGVNASGFKPGDSNTPTTLGVDFGPQLGIGADMTHTISLTIGDIVNAAVNLIVGH
jgi:RHS repeat-associated protein